MVYCIMLIFNFNIPDHGTPVYEHNNINNYKTIKFNRIGYKIALIDKKKIIKYIKIEFDNNNNDFSSFGIPNKIIHHKVQNVIIDSNIINKEYVDFANIFLTPFNYGPNPITGYYDIDNNFVDFKNIGNYGCMSMSTSKEILWSYCNINQTADIGIGSKKSLNLDWTFSNNSLDFIKKEISFYGLFKDDVISINSRGLTDYDQIYYNKNKKKFEVPQIPNEFEYLQENNEPNFIITLSGQSNSQGTNAIYNDNNIADKPHDRIYGWNSNTKLWEKADMNTESLGSFWHRERGSQSLAFHFAKCLVNAYPDIRPGIINLGLNGQPISRWTKYDLNDKFYEVNMSRSNNNQGDIYDMHCHSITEAMNALAYKTKINVMLWHQGESDGWSNDSESIEYFEQSLLKVINQYRSNVWADTNTPFIAGLTTGGDIGTNMGWEARNSQIKNINRDSDIYTRCVDTQDLEVSHSQYNNNDYIHFSANSQRIMGIMYFQAYRNIYKYSRLYDSNSEDKFINWWKTNNL